ncbi:NAD(P)H-dependent oxidoreductase [Luteimonas fraxinea]|uniref:FMN dependent NADH:quinone oxidoreductase n=1 Tax=Luteimonas fraxinea TaxID=2901869 RepID=A0ABS8UD31_9GAMM|nr:NAD(P)H-dependent oxidoreductase [Luteimonas fraxinea]MCD9096782.1 NAD(P)H-dependent oxidoreductase [Luteimonas fraxinea]MCD9126151.1 NAD(P)H-dependent oxidoreductase [Luteimonas fraxinea]UHH09869.1 NAD(P)H-dependent oxidoreductase [Luteimonas fraxinea]
MKLLHLDSAITGDASVSRRLTADIVSRLEAADPMLDITYRDLVTDPLDHFTLAAPPSPDDPNSALAQFLAADVVVIGAPMYNFAVPSQLKAWIDRILVAGSTFRYGETGAVGLAGDTRVIVAIARGNRYSENAPAAHQEHAETWLRTIFGFIGITPEFVIAEGTLLGPDVKEAALADAQSSIDALAA